MTWAQDQRIAYIKERIDHGMDVTRPDVAQRFNCTIQTVTATFHALKARYPGVMAYDAKAKAYRRADLAEAANLSWRERAQAAEAKLEAVRVAAEPFADICVGRESLGDDTEIEIVRLPHGTEYSVGQSVRRARLFMREFRALAAALTGKETGR
jgi:hypothetical protein